MVDSKVYQDNNVSQDDSVQDFLCDFQRSKEVGSLMVQNQEPYKSALRFVSKETNFEQIDQTSENSRTDGNIVNNETERTPQT